MITPCPSPQLPCFAPPRAAVAGTPSVGGGPGPPGNGGKRGCAAVPEPLASPNTKVAVGSEPPGALSDDNQTHGGEPAALTPQFCSRNTPCSSKTNRPIQKVQEHEQQSSEFLFAGSTGSIPSLGSMTNSLHFWHIRCSCGAIRLIPVLSTLQRCPATVPHPRLPPVGTHTSCHRGGDKTGLGTPDDNSRHKQARLE